MSLMDFIIFIFICMCEITYWHLLSSPTTPPLSLSEYYFFTFSRAHSYMCSRHVEHYYTKNYYYYCCCYFYNVRYNIFIFYQVRQIGNGNRLSVIWFFSLLILYSFFFKCLLTQRHNYIALWIRKINIGMWIWEEVV